ncbi:GLPGLI family protein [Chryseobacterium sp. SL1]|uniref:GLPGLI family protein n=1 Tax=Chryseobacterium sp. SL1 TaxID=2995159 RepID=UPI002273483C|nr:GLPGLI family protein [Chryseobacterium sp. SL1]MCY1661028.1 GLPGLI family protein [Chryseobacterium sp. SL1]
MRLLHKSFFLSVFLYALSFSQNIKVTYAYKPSEAFETEENVFLNNGYKISIVDSILQKKYKAKEYGADVIIEKDKGIKQYRNILIDNIGKNDTYFTYQIKKTNYLVSDNPPEIKWNLKYKETKKIGKYVCKKATATFRGTNIEAYYTPEIPVSIGPYKFKGLPGLILEVTTVGINYRYWVVKNIQYPYNGAPNYSSKYIKSLDKISIKDLVKKIDNINDEDQSMILSKVQLPSGTKLGRVETIGGNARGMVENKFEWE